MHFAKEIILLIVKTIHICNNLLHYLKIRYTCTNMFFKDINSNKLIVELCLSNIALMDQTCRRITSCWIVNINAMGLGSKTVNSNICVMVCML